MPLNKWLFTLQWMPRDKIAIVIEGGNGHFVATSVGKNQEIGGYVTHEIYDFTIYNFTIYLRLGFYLRLLR